MNTKYKENASLTRTSKQNFSQVTNKDREYVFAPVNYHVKLVIFVAMVSFGVYGLVANLLILYFKRKQYKRRRSTSRRVFRRSLAEYFINSLVLSDILCSLISLPLFAAEMFINFVQNDWICKVNRFLNIIFPVITILNLVVIGVERYCTIFYPFSVLSRGKAKKMVVAAWFFSVLITLLPIPTYKLVHFDVGEQFYTLVCKYDITVPLYRGLFVCLRFVIYIVPGFLLVFINIRILKLIRHRRRAAAFTPSYTARLKVTRMFVSLIFVFVVPYFLFIVYNVIKIGFKPKVSFTTDYVARHIGVLLCYANGAISASILFHNERYLRKMLVQLLYNILPRW